MSLPSNVIFTKRASRDAERAPLRIKEALLEWARAVQKQGVREVRKLPGYHDEPLRGDRKGQRSVRLNIQWRAIYTESATGAVLLVTVEEVTPHAY